MITSLPVACGLAACGDSVRVTDATVADAATIDAAVVVADAPVDASTVDAPDATVDATVDANVDAKVDAKPSSVKVVPCAGATLAATVKVASSGNAYEIDNPAIAVNKIVLFDMPRFHSAVSGPRGVPDEKFVARTNEQTCLQFTEVGAYPFYCDPHQFVDTITVIITAD